MYYCTEPLYNCRDEQVLIDHYNTTSLGIYACNFQRTRRISARIYLGVSVFNAVVVIATTLIFIYCATRPTTIIYNTKLTSKELRRIRKRHSIHQRSVSATTLGAFGHLVFSTCLFLTPVFNIDIACQLAFWGILLGFYTWIYAFTLRAYRLRYLFLFNQLKVKYLRMSNAERLSCINDTDYQWYLKCARKKRRLMVWPFLIYIVSIFAVLVVALPSEIMAIQTYGACYIKWSASLLVALYVVFIFILVPFMVWYLRKNSDAHGIRTEIWINAIIGVPFFFLHLVWFIFSIHGNYEESSIYPKNTVWPGNWSIFLTISAHFTSVVVPIIGYIPVENKCLLRTQRKIKKLFITITRLISCESIKQINTEETIASTRIIPELSLESLERTLADPEMMHQLQDLAIRDFSSENVLFYEKYLKIENRLKEKFAHYSDNANRRNTSRNWINSFTKKSSNMPFFTHATATHITKEQDSHCLSGDSSDKNMTILNRFMSIAIPYRLYPHFIRLYEVFIKEGAPIQVNISFKARHVIDEAFERLYQKHPALRPKQGTITTYENAASLYSSDEDDDNSDDNDDNRGTYMKSEKPDIDQSQAPHNQSLEPPAELTFNIFERARIEVCWNIFNSVYPKLVEVYNTLSLQE